MAFRYILASALSVTLLSVVAMAAPDNNNNNQGMMSLPIPGGRTAAGIMAASLDGGSRYFAPNGPIQRGITAIGTLPIRATEQANRGLTQLSSGFNNGAQSMSQAAGQNGRIEMPGLQTAESHMPQAFTRMGQQMSNLFSQKNKFILKEAEKGLQASQRAGQMMHKSVKDAMSVRSSGPSMKDSMSGLMEGPAKLMSSAHEFMTKSASTLQNQAKEHLDGVMQGMNGMQGMGSGMMDQFQGISSTLQRGAQGIMGQAQQTGQELMSQLQNNGKKNMKSMSGVMDHFQGSMNRMNSHMQHNMDGVMEHAQKTTQQLQEMAHKVAEAPMKVMASLQEGLSSMMKGAGGGHSSSGGRY